MHRQPRPVAGSCRRQLRCSFECALAHAAAMTSRSLGHEEAAGEQQRGDDAQRAQGKAGGVAAQVRGRRPRGLGRRRVQQRQQQRHAAGAAGERGGRMGLARAAAVRAALRAGAAGRAASAAGPAGGQAGAAAAADFSVSWRRGANPGLPGAEPCGTHPGAAPGVSAARGRALATRRERARAGVALQAAGARRLAVASMGLVAGLRRARRKSASLKGAGRWCLSWSSSQGAGVREDKPNGSSEPFMCGQAKDALRRAAAAAWRRSCRSRAARQRPSARAI